MKICFLCGHLKINGGNRAILTYADLLARRNHDVIVVALTHGFFRRLIKNLFGKKASWFNNLRAKVIWVNNFDEANMPDGDIIIATFWRTAFPVASYSLKKGKKFYFIQHYESLYHGKDASPDEVDKTYNLPLEKIVISRWLQEIMIEKFNSDCEAIATPVNFEQFHYLENYRKATPIRVLALHHDYHWKGTQKGKDAIDIVKKEFPDIQFVLFGARIKNIEIDCDEYFYNPSQEDLAKIYSSCHIFLCSSEYEGLGMPAMEAMACKCAVATFDTGGSRDYTIDGKTALITKQGDINELGQKLKMLVADQELREKIAENGYNFIKANFSWDKAVKKMEAIFEESLMQK